MEPKFELWVGVDWATEEHQVCGVDQAGETLFEWRVANTGDGIADLVERLLEKAGGRLECVAVAIETPHAAIVESLMARGVAAFSINPKQLDRFRDRHTLGGAKSDRLDAYVLADSLRTDTKLYRRIEFGDPVLVQLRELSRAHDTLCADAKALGSRLLAQLVRCYPQILALGSVYDDRWLWELIELAPTPAAGAGLERAKVQQLLGKYHIRRTTADQVLETLHAKPLVVAPGVAEAAAAHMKLLVPLLRLAHQQLNQCDEQIRTLMDRVGRPVENDGAREDGSAPKRQHRDADILLSVPGLGVLNSATMLAEAATALRDRDYQALRAQAGTAPVSEQTGKQRRQRPTVSMRRACNGRLRNAMYHWGGIAIQRRADGIARDHYKRLRAAGHSHGRALRGVVDRLLAMLIAMLKSDTLYDPSRRLPAEVAV